MNRKDRFTEAYHYLKSIGRITTQNDVANRMGTTQPNVSSALAGRAAVLTDNFLRRFNEAFGDIFQISWLTTGEGEMLRSPQPIIQKVKHAKNTIVAAGNNTGNVFVEADTRPSDDARNVGVCGAPVVPRPITRVQNLDVLEYLHNHDGGIERSKVIIEDVPVSCWYNVENSALAPRFMLGDMVALTSISTGMGKIVPGYVYAIDTKSMGVLLRILFEEDGHLRAHSLNPDEYPDFTIEPSDIIRIYCVMGMVRYNA